MRQLILIPFVLFLSSWSACSDSAPREKPNTDAPPITVLPKIEEPKPPAAGKDGKTDPLAQAKYEMQLYAEKSAQAEARYETLKKQANDDAIRAQTLWITGICLLLAAVAGVAAFFVPLGKKTLVAAAVGFASVAACAQAFQWAIPYLPWIGGLMVVAGGVWTVINWKTLGNATKTAAGYGDRLEDWLQDLPAEAREQANKIIADAKVEAQHQAKALGVHDPLQYLRGKLPSLWQRIANKVD